MGLDGGQPQGLHEGAGGFAAAGQAKGDHAAAAMGQILPGQGVVGAGLQPAVIHIGHLGVLLQELGHRQGVGAVAGHPDVEALQAKVQDKGVLRGLAAAEVPHQLGGGLGDESSALAEPLGIGDAVVALVGGGQAGELVGVGHPVKMAAVHDGAAHPGAVAVHILGGGVGDDVGAPLDGAAVDRSGEGVVHDQGHPVGVGGPGKLFDVQHGEGGVGDGLAKDGLGVGPERGVQLFLGGGGGDEGDVDAHLGHGDRDQVEGAAVNGGGGDDVVPALADVEQGQEVGGLPAGGQHGGGAPFQGGDLAGHGVAGGVLQAGVEVAVGLQVEQLAHVLAGVVLEGGGLDDGDLAGLAVAGGVAALHADGIAVHRELLSCPPSVTGGGGSLSQSLVAVGGDGGADGLEQLHQHDQQHHGHQHDAGLVAVVAVGDGHLA